MSHGGVSVQRAARPPSASMKDLFIAPALLPVCCVCALIRDEEESPLASNIGCRHGPFVGSMASTRTISL